MYLTAVQGACKYLTAIIISTIPPPSPHLCPLELTEEAARSAAGGDADTCRRTGDQRCTPARETSTAVPTAALTAALTAAPTAALTAALIAAQYI